MEYEEGERNNVKQGVGFTYVLPLLKTLSSFEFFSTLDAVFNGLSDPTLEDSFNTRIFFSFTSWNNALFI